MSLLDVLERLAAPIGAIGGFIVGGPAGAAIGGSIGAGISSSAAESDVAELGAEAAQTGIDEQRAARQESRQRLDELLGITRDASGAVVDRGIGAQSREQLQNFLGDPNQSLEQINPVASFLQEQGFRSIREGGAGGGRNVDRDLSEFQTNLTSSIVPQFQNQRFNQLFNILGLAQNAEAGQGTQALNAASNIGNLLNQGARSRAGGIQGTTDAILGGTQNLFSAAGAFPQLFGQPQGDFAGAVRPRESIFGSPQAGPIPATGVF